MLLSGWGDNHVMFGQSAHPGTASPIIQPADLILPAVRQLWLLTTGSTDDRSGGHLVTSQCDQYFH